MSGGCRKVLEGRVQGATPIAGGGIEYAHNPSVTSPEKIKILQQLLIVQYCTYIPVALGQEVGGAIAL